MLEDVTDTAARRGPADDTGPNPALRGEAAPPESAAGAAPDHSPAAPATSVAAPVRLHGVDLARGLAVLGMFAVHLGVGLNLPGGLAVESLAAGRAATLFVVLAGVSMALMSGGARPYRDAAMGAALWRVVIRGVLLLPLGAALTLLGAPVSVILAYYAVLFLLAVPLLNERWKVVATAAAVLAVVGPLLSFYLNGLIERGGAFAGVVAAVNAADPLESRTGEGVVDFLVTGVYPALTWLPLVLLGLAVGRLNLTARRVRLALVGVGAGLAGAAYTGSWALVELVGARPRLAATPDPVTGEVLGADGLDRLLSVGLQGNGLPTSDWVWLLVAAPHSGTPLAIAGAAGVALAVLGVCLLVGSALRWVAYPVAAVGALALTVYVAHVVAIWAVERGVAPDVVGAAPMVTITVGALVGASLWRLLVGRGPLEWPLWWVSSRVARRIP